MYAYVVQNPWTSFDPEGLAKKKDYETKLKQDTSALNDHKSKLADKTNAGEKITRSDREKLAKLQNSIDKSAKAIKEMQEVETKWNEAVGGDAMKELGRSWDDLDDTDYSYKILRQADPKGFLENARKSAETLNKAFTDDPSLNQTLVNSASQNGISPYLIEGVIIMEQRGWSQIPGGLKLKEALSSAIKSNSDAVSVGPAQLKGPARDSAGLSVDDARSYDGAIRGAANWLSNKNPSIKSNYTEAQRAAAYNGSTAYGVQYQAVRNKVLP